MIKSEYDRNYLWHSDEDENRFLAKKPVNEARFSEPRMTHKRRVKLTEDNVVIGEPLAHQSLIRDKKDINPWLKEENIKHIKTKENMKYKMNKNKQNNRRLINEFVQIDDGLCDKSTQILKKVPDISKDVDFTQERKGYEKDQQRDSNIENNVNPHKSKNVKEKENYSTQNRNIFLENQKLKNDKYKSVKVNEKQNNKDNNLPIPAKSEYQTRYAWRDPIEHNPKSARNAQMMSSWDSKLKIYNNFLSEYQRQFRPYEFVTENKYKKMKPTNDSNNVVDNIHLKFVPEKIEKRRAVTPPPRVNLNKISYKVEETINPQRISFPHGKQKRFLTEYSANYDNKWDKLEAEMQKSIEAKAREANSQAKWFQEILELRKKAQEYRQRSRGTHFSREHLGQVYSKSKNKDYDNSSNYEVEEERSSPYRENRNESQREFSNLNTRNNFNSTTHSTCNSYVNNASMHNSNQSIIIGKPKSRSHSPIPRSQTAGKPTKDNSLLLDEDASHDTDVKSIERPYTTGAYFNNHPPNFRQDNRNTCPVKNERQYTLEKYLNMNKEDSKKMKTIDYESVSKCSSNGHVSTRSMISSSTMSLALETLERAKRNRDEVLRQKS